MAISEKNLQEILKAVLAASHAENVKLAEQVRSDAVAREEALLQRLNLSTHPVSHSPEGIISSLSKRIPDFYFDPEQGLTFEKWFQRFNDVVKLGGAQLTDAEKAHFLITKLDSVCYSRLSDNILPKTTLDLSYDETRTTLERLFGEKKSIFLKRYECFKSVKSATEDYATFATEVNRRCERSNISKMSADDMKCLVFVSGLQASEDNEVRTRLLCKLDTYASAKGPRESLKLEDLVTECELLLSVQEDAKVIETSVISKIQKEDKKKKSKIENSSEKKKMPSSESKEKKEVPKSVSCFICGGNHYARDCPLTNSTMSEDSSTSSEKEDDNKTHPKRGKKKKKKTVSLVFKELNDLKRMYVKVDIRGKSIEI